MKYINKLFLFMESPFFAFIMFIIGYIVIRDGIISVCISPVEYIVFVAFLCLLYALRYLFSMSSYIVSTCIYLVVLCEALKKAIISVSEEK